MGEAQMKGGEPRSRQDKIEHAGAADHGDPTAAIGQFGERREQIGLRGVDPPDPRILPHQALNPA